MALPPCNSSGMAPQLTGRERFIIVLNCGSGNGQAEALEDLIERVLGGAGRQFELLRVSAGNELLSTARAAVEKAQGYGGIVVAAGGDGTMNAVAQAVLGNGVLMGVIPRGTFNYFGRNLGISQDAELALQTLLNAEVKEVQAGLLNEHLFLVNASIGLYPQLLEDREVYKQRFGRSRGVALWSALATLLSVPRQLNMMLSLDGEQRYLRSPSLLIANNELQMEHVGIHEFFELRNDQLVALVPRPISTLALYGLLLRGLAGLLGEAENITSFGFKEMTVRVGKGRKRLKVALDGEILWLLSPLKFRTAPQKLSLLVPADANLRERV